MPRYSQTSIDRLSTACDELQETFNRVIQIMDNSILQGHRGEREQNHYHKTGRSKLRYPESKHNSSPSLAIDAAPWPIDWDNTRHFDLFAGIVIATGWSFGHTIRWGGDWDQDFSVTDQRFNDLVHFEYAGPVVHTFIRSA